MRRLHLLSCFRRLRSDRRGNVAVIFGLAIIPVMGFMGVALDYSWANAGRTQMQTALDNTGLMLAKMMPLSDTDLQSKGWQIFQANMIKTPLKYQQGDLVITQTNTKVNLNVATTYTTQLASVLKLVGMATTFPVTSRTEVSWGNTRLRVALVLDNTGSMSSAGKIGALQTATKNLIDQLKAIVTTPGDVYISIIPFARTVNVGASNRNAAWIDQTAWTATTWAPTTTPGPWGAPPAYAAPATNIGPGSTCPYTNNTRGFVCTTGPANGSATTTTIPSSGTYKGYICPSVDSGQTNAVRNGIYYNGCYTSITYTCTGASCTCTGHSSCTCTGSGSGKTCKQPNGYYEHTWVRNASTTWNGCIADRGSYTAPGTNSGYDQQITAPVTGSPDTMFEPLQYSYCNMPMMGLSYDWTALKNMVDTMSPAGSTNQPIGLVWGWQSLVGGGPLTAPAMDTAHYTYNQYIILLSDGLNTQDFWYGNGSATNTSVDNRMYYKSGSTVTGTCKNIKDAGIKIYAVQVNTDGDPTSTLMQNCASDPSMFFVLTSSSQIVSTFQQIGNALANLHLSQ